MKYLYHYRTSDNVAHDGVVSAASRDDAFDALKAKGLKPYGIEPAPGFWNWLLGKGKRWMTITVLLAVCVVLAVAVRSGRSRESSRLPIERNLASTSAAVAYPLPRRQLKRDEIDPAMLFDFRSEMTLARYAAPGVTNAFPEIESDFSDIRHALSRPISLNPSDSGHVVEIKRIVAGIKEEVAQFLANGKSESEIAQWLEERQRMEADFRRQLIGGRRPDAKDRDLINEKLRLMALETF